MADTIEQVREVINAGLREIAEEVTRLERALKQLGPGGGDGRKAPSRRKARGKKPKQARRGQRAEQFIDFVSENPGSKGVAIATKLGVAPSQIYALAKRLEGQGKIAKSDGGYKFKSAKVARKPARKSSKPAAE